MESWIVVEPPLYTHTKFDHSFNYPRKPGVSYFICSTPRCGSSLICEALCLTGLAGVPTEYFDANTKSKFLDSWKVAETDYLASLLNRKTTPNGVFGCKTHFHQYRATFGIDQVQEFSPDIKFAWLSRRDVVRQAISYAKAVQTNQWASTHRCTNSEPAFDYQQVEKYRLEIEFEERQWQAFFDSHQIKPLRLFYEEICCDLIGTTRKICRWLGINESLVPDELPVTLQKQSDEQNEQWLKLYLDQTS